MRRTSSLTLIEMLVVIGICGVLALMLMPLLFHAKANAKAATCADRLKALGQTYALCLTQGGGVLPDAYYAFTGSAGTYQVSLRTEESGQPDGLFAGDVSDALTCPSDDRPVSVFARNAVGKAASVPSSYAYNINLPLMYRNASRVAAPVNTVTFYDGDPTGVVGTWKQTQNWAVSTLRPRHSGQANYLYLDGHVLRPDLLPAMAFGDGAGWLASSRNTNAGAAPTPPDDPVVVPPVTPPTPPTPPSPPPSDAVDFNVVDGELRPNENCTATITGIGSEYWPYGMSSPRVPVGAYYQLNKNPKVLISSDIRGGEKVTLNNVTSSDAINIIAKCTKYLSYTYTSNDHSGHCWALRSGSLVPAIKGAMGQKGVAAFLQPYMDSSGHLTIGQNDVIYLFEMSPQTDYLKYSSADFQDLVMMVTLSKAK